MPETTLATIDTILANVIDDVEDPEVRFKLRRARQLLDVVAMGHEHVDEAIDIVVSDEELLDQLREMGYLE